MAPDRLEEYGSGWAAAQALGPKLGVDPETLRKWVVQAQADDDGTRPGPTSDEQRAEGRGVESICQVLREQGLAVAPRTSRAGSFGHRRHTPTATRRSPTRCAA